ncbi:MAG: hypothetical protein IPL61_28290 [Myxococcales bacterium]|nr:hypothetical protein [Myxococcales bacterium]
MTTEPLAPLRIVTSVLMIAAGMFAALIAHATYGRGDGLTATRWIALVVYAAAALGLLGTAVPVAGGRAWATRVGAAAATAPVVVWGYLVVTSTSAPAGVIVLMAGYLGVAGLALACRGR